MDEIPAFLYDLVFINFTEYSEKIPINSIPTLTFIWMIGLKIRNNLGGKVSSIKSTTATIIPAFYYLFIPEAKPSTNREAKKTHILIFLEANFIIPPRAAKILNPKAGYFLINILNTARIYQYNMLQLGTRKARQKGIKILKTKFLAGNLHQSRYCY